MPSSPDLIVADRHRFAALCRRLSLALSAAQTYQDLVQRHQTPPRAYHDLTHVAECLAELDTARQLARNPDAMEMAIWYHDAILDNRQADNEQKSAHLARHVLLAGGASEDQAARVFELIMATCHAAAPETADARIVVDCDLAILGQPAERFDQYDAAIAQEYSWVPEDVFRQKRADVLQQFLARARIFQTDQFFERYEQRARQNLERTVNRLLHHS